MNNKIEKLSYEELIKALQCCANTIETNMCGECPAAKYKAGKCDALVKLQAAEMLEDLKAENERLQQETKNTNGLRLEIFENKSVWERLARAEAIKEFAERLKNECSFETDVSLGYGRPCYEDAIPIIAIDNLLKEVVGEQG